MGEEGTRGLKLGVPVQARFAAFVTFALTGSVWFGKDGPRTVGRQRLS